MKRPTMSWISSTTPGDWRLSRGSLVSACRTGRRTWSLRFPPGTATSCGNDSPFEGRCMVAATPSDSPTAQQISAARERLDAHVREIVRWHFDPETGTPFWLDRAKSFKFNPIKDVQGFDDLNLFGIFE